MTISILYCRILPIVFLGFFALSLQYPILAPLLLSPESGFNFFNLPSEIMYGFALGVFPLGQFFGAPIVGTYSDMLGRKKAFTLVFIMLSVGHLLLVFAVYFKHYLLFVSARFLSGLFEGIVPLARAMAADLNDRKVKAGLFGYINAAATSAYLIGPFISGLLSVNYISSAYIYVFFILSFLINVVALFYLHLFYKPENQANKFMIPDFENSIKQRVKYILEPLKLTNYIYLFVMSCLITLSFNVYYKFIPALIVKKLHYSAYEISLSTACLALSMIFSQTFLSKQLSKYIETQKIIICMSLALAFLMTYAAQTIELYNLLLINIPIGLCIGIIGINIPIFISNISSPQKQGQIMGLMMSLKYFAEAIFAMIGGFLAVSNSSIPIYYGAFFIVTGVLIFIFYLQTKSGKMPATIQTQSMDS